MEFVFTGSEADSLRAAVDWISPHSWGEGQLLSTARALAPEIAVGAAARDAARALPSAALDAVKRAGLLTARIAKMFGGPGETWTEVSRIVWSLSRADPNVGQAVQPHFTILETIRVEASPAQRERFYGAVLRGEMITNAVAERGGAFYGEIATTARRGPDGIQFDGTKYYATGSLFAEHIYITGRDPEGVVLAAVLPKTRAGISVIDDWNGMGQRTTASGTVRLDGVLAAPEEVFALVPPTERRWHLQAAAQLLHVAVDAGIAQGALDDALDLCRKRGRTLKESGVPKATDDPYILQAIGQMSVLANGAVALLERAGPLVDRAADAFFAGQGSDALFAEASIAVAEAKIAATEAALGVSEKLYQVANASGTDRALNLDRHWRNARTHTTHDPVAYKAKFIGDYLLNGRLPPPTAKI